VGLNAQLPPNSAQCVSTSPRRCWEQLQRSVCCGLDCLGPGIVPSVANVQWQVRIQDLTFDRRFEQKQNYTERTKQTTETGNDSWLVFWRHPVWISAILTGTDRFSSVPVRQHLTLSSASFSFLMESGWWDHYAICVYHSSTFEPDGWFPRSLIRIYAIVGQRKPRFSWFRCKNYIDLHLCRATHHEILQDGSAHWTGSILKMFRCAKPVLTIDISRSYFGEG
jgi:hypothetical protein